MFQGTSTTQSGTAEAVPYGIGYLVDFCAALPLGCVEELLLLLARAVDSTHAHPQQADWLPVSGQASPAIDLRPPIAGPCWP